MWRTVKLTAALWCSMLAFPGTSPAQTQEVESARKYDEFIELNCEDMMARLDNYAIALQVAPSLRASIVSYGRTRGLFEARGWAVAAKKYLVSNRGIASNRITTLYGGNRERRTMALWLLPRGYGTASTPQTVQPAGVKFKAGKIRHRPCSFWF